MTDATDKPAAGAWVYILRCRDGSLYTGWTLDIDRRMTQHGAGQASRYTRARLPVALVYVEPVPSKRHALRREYSLRRLSRSRKLRLVSGSALRVQHPA